MVNHEDPTDRSDRLPEQIDGELEPAPVDATKRQVRRPLTDEAQRDEARVDDDAPGNFVDQDEGDIPEPNEPG